MKLIIVISGRKAGGKNTIANQIAADYLNTQFEINSYSVSKTGRLTRGGDEMTIEHGLSEESQTVGRGIRVIAFASPLKDFCMNVLGLSKQSCYGSDGDKNKVTHIKWDGLPLRVRMKYRRRWWHWPRTGYMTGREVMQVFGTDVIRDWYGDAWAKAGYALAAAIPEEVSIICDGRFPNEMRFGEQYKDPAQNQQVFYIRTLRKPLAGDVHLSETALDDWPMAWFDLVVPEDITVEQQRKLVTDNFWSWVQQTDPHRYQQLKGLTANPKAA
jgi:hypothetical protein